MRLLPPGQCGDCILVTSQHLSYSAWWVLFWSCQAWCWCDQTWLVPSWSWRHLSSMLAMKQFCNPLWKPSKRLVSVLLKMVGFFPHGCFGFLTLEGISQQSLSLGCKLGSVFLFWSPCSVFSPRSKHMLLFKKLLTIFIEFGGGGRETHWFIVPLIDAFIGCFFYVPWLGIEPTTLVYRDDALTNWATKKIKWLLWWPSHSL